MKHQKRQENKLTYNILISLGVIFLFLLIILGAFSIMTSYKGFYISEYEKNGVYDKLSDNRTQAKAEAAAITENLLEYFKGKEDLKYFTPDEQAHLRDVKFLMNAMNFIYYSSAIFFIAILAILYFRFKKNVWEFISSLSKILFIGSIVTLSVLGIILLLSLLNFTSTFTAFHIIFFPQGNWMFENSSLLITLFPEKFFFDIAVRIFIYAIFQSVIFLLISIWLRKQLRAYEKYYGERK